MFITSRVANITCFFPSYTADARLRVHALQPMGFETRDKFSPIYIVQCQCQYQCLVVYLTSVSLLPNCGGSQLNWDLPKSSYAGKAFPSLPNVQCAMCNVRNMQHLAFIATKTSMTMTPVSEASVDGGVYTCHHHHHHLDIRLLVSI